jgi:ABC-type polysaccharide/polyol phosphate transport system ATPase subunit
MEVLFVDTSFQLNPGNKVGLVGPNGACRSAETFGCVTPTIFADAH